MLYLLDVRQIDGNRLSRTNFETEQNNDLASTTQTSLTRTRAAKQSRPEPPQLPHVGRHVGEAPGAGTEIAERNEFETVLQTVVRSA